jgi:hypothetical protein
VAYGETRNIYQLEPQKNLLFLPHHTYEHFLLFAAPKDARDNNEEEEETMTNDRSFRCGHDKFIYILCDKIFT